MRFTDLLRAGALLSGGAATVIAGATVSFGFDGQAQELVLLATVWWLICMTSGVLVVQQRAGRPSEFTSRLLMNAPVQRTPEAPRVGRTLASYLWPLAVGTFAAVIGGALIGPQVPGAVAGFPLVWALLWRAQEFAVKEIEERDGAVFLVVPTGPLRPFKLVRGPGLRREHPTDPSTGRPGGSR